MRNILPFLIGYIVGISLTTATILLNRDCKANYDVYELTTYSVTSGCGIYRKHIVRIDTGNIIAGEFWRDTAHYKIRKLK